MEPDFWHDRWRSGRIGFHQTSIDRSLRRHWPSLDLPAGSRVFVPLCGKSLDLLWLRDQGLDVVGVELSSTAVESFFLENGIPARRRVQGPFDLYEAPGIRLFRGDFFALTAGMLGDLAAVYDRAALISWTPALRGPYVEHLAHLLRPGIRMLLISLEYAQPQMAGPPFSVTADEVRRLFSPHFELEEIDRQDILEREARFRGAGIQELFEVCYQLVRL